MRARQSEGERLRFLDCHTLIRKPLYDTTQGQITTMAARGGQQQRSFPVIQLVPRALESMHAVWRMPPYRWSRRLQRVFRTRQRQVNVGSRLWRMAKSQEHGSIPEVRGQKSPVAMSRVLGPLNRKIRSWEGSHVVPLRARSNSGVSSR